MIHGFRLTTSIWNWSILVKKKMAMQKRSEMENRVEFQMKIYVFQMSWLKVQFSLDNEPQITVHFLFTAVFSPFSFLLFFFKCTVTHAFIHRRNATTIFMVTVFAGDRGVNLKMTSLSAYFMIIIEHNHYAHLEFQKLHCRYFLKDTLYTCKIRSLGCTHHHIWLNQFNEPFLSLLYLCIHLYL